MQPSPTEPALGSPTSGTSGKRGGTVRAVLPGLPGALVASAELSLLHSPQGHGAEQDARGTALFKALREMEAPVRSMHLISQLLPASHISPSPPAPSYY